MYSADACQGRSKTLQRFDVMSRGEVSSKHSLGVRCRGRRSHFDWIPECYLYGRRSLRAFNGPPSIEVASRRFLLAALVTPSRVGHGVSAAFGWPMGISLAAAARDLSGL
jgi:hypothetical protein